NILFEVNPHETNPLIRLANVLLGVLWVGHVVERNFTLPAERRVILRDLVIFGHVRVEIVFPVELADRRNFTLQNQTGEGGLLERLEVHCGQCTWESQANRTYMDVWFRTVLDGATTKHFAAGIQLDMHFQPDCCDVITLHACGQCAFISTVGTSKPQGVSNSARSLNVQHEFWRSYSIF